MPIFQCIIREPHSNPEFYEIHFRDEYENGMSNTIKIMLGKPGNECKIKHQNREPLKCVIHRDQRGLVWISTNTKIPHENQVTLYNFLTGIGIYNGDSVRLRYLTNNTFELLK